jgi:hypothetical protein
MNLKRFFHRRQTPGTRAAVATCLFGIEFRCITGALVSSSQASDTQPIDMQTVLLVEDDLTRNAGTVPGYSNRSSWLPIAPGL